jgi:hypothetical protein
MTSKDGDLRPIFAQSLPTFHWVAVETGLLGRGIPDTEYCAPGGATGWVEFKQTTAWAVDLRPEQVAWLDRRSRMGGRALIAVRRRFVPAPGSRREACDELWILPGSSARLVHDSGLRSSLSASPLGCWTGGPRHWDWPAIARVLTS